MRRAEVRDGYRSRDFYLGPLGQLYAGLRRQGAPAFATDVATMGAASGVYMLIRATVGALLVCLNAVARAAIAATRPPTAPPPAIVGATDPGTAAVESPPPQLRSAEVLVSAPSAPPVRASGAAA